MSMDNRTRWIALIILCCGDLMIVLDTTIVNVALSNWPPCPSTGSVRIAISTR